MSLELDSTGRALILEGHEPCFICKRPTLRLDTCFEAPFCDSDECNVFITKDWEARDGRLEAE
jgi:hypothetical protein